MVAMEVAGIVMIFWFMSLVSDPEIIQRLPVLQRIYDYLSPDSLNNFLLMVGFSVLTIFVLKGVVALWGGRINCSRLISFSRVVRQDRRPWWGGFWSLKKR